MNRVYLHSLIANEHDIRGFSVDTEGVLTKVKLSETLNPIARGFRALKITPSQEKRSCYETYLSFWTNASPRRKRIYSIISIFIVAFIVTVIGSFVPLSPRCATISQNLNTTLNQNKANNTLTQYIFLNNFSNLPA